MTVRELLDHLDGAGLTITDYAEMQEPLAQAGLALDSELNEAQWTATDAELAEREEANG